MSLSLHSALPGQNVTLTPLHLRKAKLMFFYVRYPSSVLLKNYFCDVHFNKNNTAQLVKWFSNFREFYYIQMEKYARQSIAEGLSADQVEVTTESELYKILNLHYNRNNQIETTLREFFRAIAVGKDREQSWKKPIYKVIARLDDIVPEYFKSQDWMEQLSD
ncbi:pros [Bugula neritina]|uniref:Pros n=1 Tax=Bugula neritina TaxID=10212 RepID=A0A7J7JCA2_BUGNE|nr:pros [Bugula neritina]